MHKFNKQVTIIGAGLAGCEAAYQLSKRGIKCRLFDIKPNRFTRAHSDKNLAELVCSNSLKSDDLSAASGLLKHELRLMDSLCIRAADATKVPAGGALAVDRRLFSEYITQKILNDKNIEFVSQTVTDFDENTPTIIATGPLTMEPLLSSIQKKLGETLNFYDAAAPIIAADSIDYSSAFSASRYDKGEGEYVNCPLNKDEYTEFITALTTAQTVTLKEFEKGDVFEGCMPVEIMAKRGFDSLRFGPLKPVGLRDKDGKRPYAVLQLRKENAAGEMYNLVGFQTNLTFKEQKRVFGLIPALKNAEYLRYGLLHRNSFINAPTVLNAGFKCKKYPNIFVAGQLSGVEGYVESVMSGLIAAVNIYLSLTVENVKNAESIKEIVKNTENCKEFIPPPETMCGALCRYITLENKNFQPMNANFGLLPPLNINIKDKIKRKEAMSQRAVELLTEFFKSSIIL